MMESLGAAATLAKATGLMGDGKEDDEEKPSMMDKAKSGLAGILGGAAEALGGGDPSADDSKKDSVEPKKDEDATSVATGVASGDDV